MYVCKFMNVCAYICTKHTYVYMHACIHVCTYVYINSCNYIHTYAHSNSCTYVHVHIFVYVHTYVWIHVCMVPYTYVLFCPHAPSAGAGNHTSIDIFWKHMALFLRQRGERIRFIIEQEQSKRTAFFIEHSHDRNPDWTSGPPLRFKAKASKHPMSGHRTRLCLQSLWRSRRSSARA